MTENQVKKEVLSRYNAKRKQAGERKTDKLSRQVDSLIEFMHLHGAFEGYIQHPVEN